VDWGVVCCGARGVLGGRGCGFGELWLCRGVACRGVRGGWRVLVGGLVVASRGLALGGWGGGGGVVWGVVAGVGGGRRGRGGGWEGDLGIGVEGGGGGEWWWWWCCGALWVS